LCPPQGGHSPFFSHYTSTQVQIVPRKIGTASLGPPDQYPLFEEIQLFTASGRSADVLEIPPYTELTMSLWNVQIYDQGELICIDLVEEAEVQPMIQHFENKGYEVRSELAWKPVIPDMVHPA